MTSNFLLNNSLTYRDRRLKGLGHAARICRLLLDWLAGVFTNVGIASWFYAEREGWWVSGAAGAIMGALWNYAMSSLFIWRTR